MFVRSASVSAATPAALKHSSLGARRRTEARRNALRYNDERRSPAKRARSSCTACIARNAPQAVASHALVTRAQCATHPLLPCDTMRKLLLLLLLAFTGCAEPQRGRELALQEARASCAPLLCSLLRG